MRFPTLICAVAALTMFGGVTLADDDGDGSSNRVRARLSSSQEVPSLSSEGTGRFNARIDTVGQTITYELSFSGLSTSVTQAHIHFGQKSVNGGIVVFLCSNLGNGPAGTQACPAGGGTITGTIGPANVSNPNEVQGIAPGEFGEIVKAIREGLAYANVHTTKFAGGEIRGQLEVED
jgi:hypothetical protein